MSRWRRSLALVMASACLAGLALWLAACDSGLTTAPQETALPTGAPTAGLPTAAPTATELPPVPVTVTLTIWTTESFSPTMAVAAGQGWARQADAFELAHPDVTLDFILKKERGKGGMVDYMLTTAAAVPELLPDVAIVPADELAIPVQAGILQPLDALIPAELVEDLYPFAVEAVTWDGYLFGLQYQADLDHLLYDTGELTVPPRSWPGVLSGPGVYALPAGGQSGLVNHAFLTQYLAVRPWSAETDAEPFLELESLTAVLQFYQDGLNQGVLTREVLDYHTTDDCLAAYDAGQAALSHVSAHRYLLDKERLQGAGVAPIPAINGAGPAITEGWVLVLVTADPARQALAADWMLRLMAPEVVEEWNQAAGYLPTRQSVLAAAGEEDSYARFIHQQMLLARPRPRLSNYAQVAAALQRAVEQVLTGAATPAEAATTALGAQ